jgi:hypothetical protein
MGTANQHSAGAKLLWASAGAAAVGILVGIVTIIALTFVRPVLVAFAVGSLVIVLPSFIVRDQRAYWLFLFVVSIPFDISKRTTTWLVQPWELYHEYGMPASGTLSIDLYLTDIVLFLLLLPWFGRICLRRDRLYFPRIGYIYLAYLAWALITSMIEATSFYLSIFEWCRQVLYFLSFVYVANNVVTRTQFRAVLAALLVGLTIASASVISFYCLQIGTETFAFSKLYKDQPTQGQLGTLYVSEGSTKGTGEAKRSAGIFAHPSHAAYYLEYLLPLVLAYLIGARRNWERVLFGGLFGAGWIALSMTFSRAPVVGLLCGCAVVIIIARASELISRQAFARCVLVFGLLVMLSSPLLIHYLTTRPESVTKRWELNEIAFNTFLKRPLFGAGLNNSSIVTEGAESIVTTSFGRERVVAVIHNHYLIMLIEVGLLGFILVYSFFWQVVVIALRRIRITEMEFKLLLVGIVGSLASITVHNFGDPFGGHVVHGMLWLHVGLLVAVCRQVSLVPRPRVATIPHPVHAGSNGHNAILPP